MASKKATALVVAISLFLLITSRSPDIMAAVQKTYVLDLDDPGFVFDDNMFNDTSTSKEYDYPPGGGNVTYSIRMPGNSTMFYASLVVTGKITYIYQSQINSPGLLGASIGNITTDEGNEIVTGSTSAADSPNVYAVRGYDGGVIWNYNLSSPNNDVFSSEIGNVTDYPGNEIVIGTEDSTVYVLNVNDTEASEAWNYPTGGDVYGVRIYDIDIDSVNEVIAGSNRLYVLNDSGGLECQSSIMAINDLDIGNISIDSGYEIVVATGTFVRVLNSTCDVLYDLDIGSTVETVSVGNITSEDYDEIVVGSGGSDDKVYLFNSSLNQTWNYSAQDDVRSTSIGDVVGDYMGNEVIAGSNDKKVYTLNSSGDLIWYYEAASFIETVSVGNLTTDKGDEVAAGSGNGMLYTFNFDYFPLNLSIDIGSNGTYDWTYLGSLRNSQNVTGIEGSLQYHLDGQCAGNGLCDVPLRLFSENRGKLNVSDINISYLYNVSTVVNYTTINSIWSRTSNVVVNESIGYQVKNVSFLDFTDHEIDVRYINMSSVSDGCDFNNSAYENVTVDSDNTCNIPNFLIPGSGSLPEDFHFWESIMNTAVPVEGNDSGYTHTNETDDFVSRKTLMVWNTSGTRIFNVSHNTTISDGSIVGMYFLNVTWINSVEYEITPQSDAICDGSASSYTYFFCGGDPFFVCKNGSFFDWIQPWSRGMVTYSAGGVTNLPANLSGFNVTLNNSIWGDWFNYSVFVNDTDGDSVNVTLWYWLESGGKWVTGSEEEVTGEGNVWFNLTSDKTWTGANSYKFQFQDFNSSGYPIHSIENSSIFWGPGVRKHNTETVYVSGNDSNVNRTQTIELVTRINDTDNNTWTEDGVSCIFWVTYNDTEFDSGHFNTTNQSGHCIFYFAPDGNYTAGNHLWKSGVLGDSYYNDSNSTDFILNISGMANISIVRPQQNDIVYRNTTGHFEARIIDQYGSGINQSGFNCTFWFNETYLGSNDTGNDGHCHFYWLPQCSNERIDYIFNVTISNETGNYLILGDMDWIDVSLFDVLGIAIENQNYTLFHKGENITLNSSVNDTCELCGPGDYQVNWSLKWKRSMLVTVNKTPGYDMQTFPVIINSSYLESQGIDPWDWDVNYTRVTLNGVEVSSRVNIWNDSNKTVMNWTQEYFGEYSELVFIANQSDWENLTYEVTYNRSDGQEGFAFIENGGFESGTIPPWRCFGSNTTTGGLSLETCDGTYCDCEIRQEGSEANGSYSLYLSSDDWGAGNPSIQGISTYLGHPVSENRIKIRYKPTGEFDAGAYIRVYAGSGMCELSNVTDAWHEDVCTNSSFASADWINITVHDVGDGGSEASATHVYVDYICIADSSGNCINHNSGYSHDIGIASESSIDNGDNVTWDVSAYETVGMRKVIANASGYYYSPGREVLYMYIYGWSNLSGDNISSTNCTYSERWICRQNATMDVLCIVQDANTSQWIEDYNVSFWMDGIYMGSNTTDQNGTALLNIVDTSDQTGNHTMTCNITDDSYVFYNVTENTTADIPFNISSGNTTALVEINISPQTPADSLTKEFSHTYYLQMNITNNGTYESMYDVDVEINTPAGISAQPASCPPIGPGMSCNRTSVLTVYYTVTEDIKDVYVNVSWINSDITPDNVSNATSITVVNNTVLNITETQMVYEISRGDSEQIGNFTVESFGNTDLLSITFSESGGNSTDMTGWISYSPVSVPDIGHTNQKLVNVTATVPGNATEGEYRINITANATGSQCNPSDECWDVILLILNVTEPDWRVSTNTVNKTIGLSSGNGTIGNVVITNNADYALDFNVSMTGNGTSVMSLSDVNFTVSPLSTHTLQIYHNTSGSYLDGYYLSNITIENNNSAFPPFENITALLNVINFTITVISPNQTSPLTDITSGGLIEITANATISGSPVTSNMLWYARIGQSTCTGLKSSYNATTEFWEINCTAPYLTGNPLINDLNLTGYYTTESAILTIIEDNAVIYRDITPPHILDIWVQGSDPEGNVKNSTMSEIIINATLTDNDNVNSTWAQLYYQDSLQGNYSMYNAFSNVWNFNFTSPINEGDYRVIIYANDTLGNENDTSSLVTGYFDLYIEIDINGSLYNKDGTPIESNFTLYKSQTKWNVHEFHTNGTGGYNWILHRRAYDVEIEFGEHDIIIYGADINSSAVIQHGEQNPGNITSPITLDLYTSENVTDIGVSLPTGAENPIMVLGIEHEFNRTSSNIYINLDYTKALQDFYTYVGGGTITETDLGVYRCANWTMSTRKCDGSFENVSIASSVDTVNEKISFTTTGTSAYAIAEWEGTEDGNGNGDDDGDGSSGSSGSSSSSASSSATSTTLPFTVTTSIGNIRIQPGGNKSYLFSVKNKLSSTLNISIGVEGLEDFITVENSSFVLGGSDTETMNITVSVPDNMGTGTYTGTITVTSGSNELEIPVTMTVSVDATDLLYIDIDVLTPNVNQDGKIRFAVDIKNLGLMPGFNVSMVYIVKDSENERVVAEDTEYFIVEDVYRYTKTMYLNEKEILPIGQYYLEVWAYFGEGRSVNEVNVFNIVEPYWSSWEGRIILLFIAFIGMSIIGYYVFKRYQKWKIERGRYIFPLDFRKLPSEGKESFWLGKIAETDRKAWFNSADLTTHLLIAGSTGAGKSVSASVFVEEALEKNIPVLVFDPTAQWTGFVKALDDNNLKKYYTFFGMNPKETKPFKGMIFEITDTQQLLFDIKEGFEKYLMPGEITVFTLDKLRPGQYDEAVNIIIEALFNKSWEESGSLKMLVVFDEVHRLLEKYGGRGGYVSLERAAREFRKWGIGMIMASQVLADFKEAIAGNVLTEIQLNTKSLTDIQKVETKYGGEYARKISRQGVGVGMIQNPKYNDGKPYFIEFRPTWHNPHKISEDDMKVYKEFAKRLDVIDTKIAELKRAGRDTFDTELELKLAKDKLKQGRFRMAQIYITSLEQHLKISKGD